MKVDSAILEQTDLLFQRYAIILPAVKIAAPDIPNPDDAWIIAAAQTASVDWFVTGDKALLDIGHASGEPIIHPRQAYMRLRRLS